MLPLTSAYKNVLAKHKLSGWQIVSICQTVGKCAGILLLYFLLRSVCYSEPDLIDSEIRLHRGAQALHTMTSFSLLLLPYLSSWFLRGSEYAAPQNTNLA